MPCWDFRLHCRGSREPVQAYKNRSDLLEGNSEGRMENGLKGEGRETGGRDQLDGHVVVQGRELE